jgi:hypothetical protein
MTKKETTLWKFNQTTGYWDFCRTCHIETAEQWLKAWQSSEPNEQFKISSRKPK